MYSLFRISLSQETSRAPSWKLAYHSAYTPKIDRAYQFLEANEDLASVRINQEQDDTKMLDNNSYDYVVCGQVIQRFEHNQLFSKLSL